MEAMDYVGIGGRGLAAIVAYKLLFKTEDEKAAEEEAAAEFKETGAIGGAYDWLFGKKEPAAADSAAQGGFDLQSVLSSIGPAGMGANLLLDIVRAVQGLLATPPPEGIPAGATVQPGGLVIGGSPLIGEPGALQPGQTVSVAVSPSMTIVTPQGTFTSTATPEPDPVPGQATASGTTVVPEPTLNVPSGYTSYSSYAAAQTAPAVTAPLIAAGFTQVTYPNGVICWV